MISIHGLISRGMIHSRFQPIVSLKTRSVIGFEALSYGEHDGSIISPLTLFENAAREDSLLELDRECRRAALAAFKGMGCDENMLLFVNFESSLIDIGVAGSGVFLSQCRNEHVNPSCVVIEIVESRVRDEAALKRFVDIHRGHGFIIAIDDVGEGYSNFNRITLIRPDIIKADRALARGIGTDYMKQKIVSSLSGLSRGIGALFLLEGIETEEEALTAFGLGAELFQGYHIARPGETDDESMGKHKMKIEELAVKAKDISIRKAAQHSDHVTRCFTALNTVADRLASSSVNLFFQCLSGFMTRLEKCECLYVIDCMGTQVTETVLASRFHEKIRIPAVFRPAPKGSDHSLKEYFYIASLNKRHYVSDSYISFASGRLCITLSIPFTHELTGGVFFLCADYNA